jgi:hypothetical protein
MDKTVEIRGVGGQRVLWGSRGVRCLIIRYAGHRVVLSCSDGGSTEMKFKLRCE